MSKVTLGGDRLGSGNKQEVNLRNYERSTHDLSYIWRSTMASGTLVPFMSEVALPGDTFDINLNVDVKTHPTIGPLFGSYKVQLDVFAVPVRLYNAKLHMNMLNIGLKMQDIKLPQIRIGANKEDYISDNSQINPSSLFAYLDIRGIGTIANEFSGEQAFRDFNAIPYLAYWDIYKQYYANKQEEYGMYIHNDWSVVHNNIHKFVMIDENNNEYDLASGATPLLTWKNARIEFDATYEPNANNINLTYVTYYGTTETKSLTNLFVNVIWHEDLQILECKDPRPQGGSGNRGLMPVALIESYTYNGSVIDDTKRPRIEKFELKKIDEMRERILADVFNPAPFVIGLTDDAPYGPPLNYNNGKWCSTSNQEGLALKTYKSDLFNNWIKTDWIDGENGINEITRIDTTEGFTLDTLLLSRKVYDMLNRIAVSGGTYDDWLNAVYTHERTRGQENPAYVGGLIKELAFQEVVSNAAALNQDTNQPLGTLAGRGVLTKKHKGGKIYVKVDEPSYIMGIASLTPVIDYSQGNKWSVNLKTMDDFHKPQLDELGFQDLITEGMAWWDSKITDGGVTQYSAGKQPAWINYMTNVNIVRGNFAEEFEQMFMTLNRRYERKANGHIKDLSSYVDPSKYNNIFSDTRLDAQNFWTQISVDITARRKMSARLMPNL